MKIPWFSSEKSPKKNIQHIDNNKKEEVKKTYKLTALPENIQKIAILIKQNDEEIKYLNKKLDVSLSAKKILEEDLSKKLKSIKE